MIRTSVEKGMADRVHALIKVRAYSFYCTTTVPYDELVSEGIVTYVRALHSYKSGRGVKFTTYLYGCLNIELSAFCKRWRRQLPAMLLRNKDDVLPDIAAPAEFDRRVALQDMINKLTPAAQGVAMILEECADEIIKQLGPKVKDPHSPKHIKGALRKYLLRLGWRRSVIDSSFLELSKLASAI